MLPPRLILLFVIQKDMGFQKAFRYIRLAADQGQVHAQFDLGCCYRNGYGVPKDLKEAVRYFQLAADQGNAATQSSLAACYKIGNGVPKDMPARSRLLLSVSG